MARSGRRWRRRTLEQWQALLERQAASGQSVEAFCRGESVTTASFYRWRKQLGGQGAVAETTAQTGPPAPAFVDLGTLGGADTAAAVRWELELELALGGGVVVRLRGG